MAGFRCIDLGVILGALAVGCGVRQVSPRVAAPSRPQPGDFSASSARQDGARPAAAPEVLRSAIVASLTPTRPPAEQLDAAEEIEPIDPLVRAEYFETPAAPQETSSSAARLPPESIRRVVRQNAGRFRDCIARRSAATDGRVIVSFVIGLDGRVWRAEEESVSFGDREARICLLAGFFQLTFPNPGAQTIVVRYPLSFTRDASLPRERLPSARQAAEPPPPGFAEAMRAGQHVAPPPPFAEPHAPRTNDSSGCTPGDPLCFEL